jgi:hypothetical protein
LFKEILNALLIKLAAGVEVICVLFIGAVLAKQSPVVAAVTQSINIWMIFAENLEISLILSNQVFDKYINLYSGRLLNVNSTIIFALAT